MTSPKRPRLTAEQKRVLLAIYGVSPYPILFHGADLHVARGMYRRKEPLCTLGRDQYARMTDLGIRVAGDLLTAELRAGIEAAAKVCDEDAETPALLHLGDERARWSAMGSHHSANRIRALLPAEGKENPRGD